MGDDDKVEQSLVEELWENANHQGSEYMERLLRLSAKRIIQLEAQSRQLAEALRGLMKSKNFEIQPLENVLSGNVPNNYAEMGENLMEAWQEARTALAAFDGGE